MYLDPTQVSGHTFSLARTDPRHLTGELDPIRLQTGSSSFGQMLLDSLADVNGLQQTAEQLAVAAIVDPNSVNVHDVTIAEAKANLSLSIAKSIVDKVVQAYREISNIR